MQSSGPLRVAVGRLPGRPGLLPLALAAAAFWWLVLADSVLWFHTFPRPPIPADFQPYFGAARIGLAHGWSHIYDLGLQRIEFYLVNPPSRVFDAQSIFVTPPPMAWIIAPLAAALPYSVAYWVFVSTLAIAYAVTGWWVTPGSPVTRAAVVLAGATTYPVLICLGMGQVALLVGVAMVVSWALLRRGHWVAAGLVLSALVLKPQVAYLVPLALIAWGAWRTAAVAAASAAVIAAVAALSLGSTGISEFSQAISIENHNLDNQIWTPAIFFGPNAAAYAVEAAAAVAALVIAFLARRRRDPGTAIVAGLVGSLVAAPYHHGADSFCLVAAFWIALNLKPSRVLAAWLALGAVAAFLEPPTGPRPLLVFAMGWLVIELYTAIRESTARRAAAGVVAEPEPSPA
jgi:Glycosyltransferase family 87